MQLERPVSFIHNGVFYMIIVLDNMDIWPIICCSTMSLTNLLTGVGTKFILCTCIIVLVQLLAGKLDLITCVL